MAYKFKCTPTFKLYHHRFCGLGFHPRTDTTVFRANIQKKGKYYKRNLFENLEDALQWLIDATPIYIEQEKTLQREHFATFTNATNVDEIEGLQKDIDSCKARIKELEKFLADATLQQKLYLASPLTNAEIKEAMRLWRGRDFTLAGRITLKDRNGRKYSSGSRRKNAKKRRRSSSGTGSKASKKYVRKLPSHFQFYRLNLKLEQKRIDSGASSCIRCCGAFNPRSSSTNRENCRNCDNDTSVSQLKNDPITTYQPNVFKNDPSKADYDQFSLNELPPRARTESFEDLSSFKTFHIHDNYLPDLPPLSSPDELSPRNLTATLPLAPIASPMKSEFTPFPDHQENIFDLLNEPIKIDSNEEVSEFPVKLEPDPWVTPPFFRLKTSTVIDGDTTESEAKDPMGPFELTSMFSGPRASLVKTCLDLFSRSMYNLLSGDLKGFVRRGSELLQKIGEYIENQEGVVIEQYYNSDATDMDVESLQLWNQAVHTAKVFRRFEVSGTSRRARQFQLDEPEMYETWNKGYSRAISFLRKCANEPIKVITVNYQALGTEICQKEMAQLMQLPETLLHQFLSGMESCGLRNEICLPTEPVEYYFNYRRFARPQIGLFESFGVGPNFLRKENEDLCVYVAATGNWIKLSEKDIIKREQNIPAYMIAREMERYHNPESSYHHFEKELYEILFRDVIKME